MRVKTSTYRLMFPRKAFIHFRILLLLLVSAPLLKAQTLIDPIDDGDIYGLSPSPNSVDDTGYVAVSGYIEGALVFSNFNSAPYNNISLELNPYAEPLYASIVAVYGIADSGSKISPNDYNQGTYLGSFTNVSSLHFGQQTLLNVTSFVKSDTASDFEFILVDNDTDIFSSTNYNYGESPGLIVSAPAPPTWAMLLGGLGLLAFFHRRALRS